MDWTAMGASPPTATWPTWIFRVFLLAVNMVTGRQSRKFKKSKSKCRMNSETQNPNDQNWMGGIFRKHATYFQEIEPWQYKGRPLFAIAF
jgi:hypothetical protein